MILVTAANGHVACRRCGLQRRPLTVKLGRVGRGNASIYVRGTPNSDRKFSALVALCRRFAPESKPSIRALHGNEPMPKATPTRVRRASFRAV